MPPSADVPVGVMLPALCEGGLITVPASAGVLHSTTVQPASVEVVQRAPPPGTVEVKSAEALPLQKLAPMTVMQLLVRVMDPA